MNVKRILTTLAAAAAVSGGITVAVAQSAMPPRPNVEPDSGAITPRPQMPAASANSSSAPAAMAPAASEPAAQPTRG